MPEDNRPATKQELLNLEERLSGRMNDLEERLSGRMNDLEERLSGKMRDMEERLVETMRDMQTEVLRAFHGWARPAEIKLRSHEERLTLLEERIAEIERGKHL